MQMTAYPLFNLNEQKLNDEGLLNIQGVEVCQLEVEHSTGSPSARIRYEHKLLAVT